MTVKFTLVRHLISPLVEIIKKFQRSVDYGTIELMREDVPGAKLTIQVDCGMCEGYKQFEIKKDGSWTAIAYKTIKNQNLDKKKPLKGA